MAREGKLLENCPGSGGTREAFKAPSHAEAWGSVEKRELNREKKMQQAMLDIKKKFGKNAILKGINMEEGATGKERNKQIGGHKA